MLVMKMAADGAEARGVEVNLDADVDLQFNDRPPTASTNSKPNALKDEAALAALKKQRAILKKVEIKAT